MTTNIQKWGNSQGIRLPKHLLDSLKWAENETITIKAEKDRIVIEQADPKRHMSIEELVEDFDGEYRPEEIDWGDAAGREVW